MDEQTIPDVYCDGIQLQVTPFGLSMSLTQSPPSPGGTEPPKKVAYVRMSLEHAKIMAILLRRVLKQHEEQQSSPIILHPQLYTQMGISREEDW